jgi:hypothetical protein
LPKASMQPSVLRIPACIAIWKDQSSTPWLTG